MRPVAMTTAVRRGERQDQEKRVAESGAGPSARVHDPHANPQLVQALPRRPVREAPISRPDRLLPKSRSHRNQPLGCAWPTLYTT